MGAAALAEAIARIEGRFGARAVARASDAERHRALRRFATGTSFDRVTGGGITAGEALALAGEGGKLTLALRAVAGAQRDGGMVLWVDRSSSFDPLAAARAAVDLERLVVVRARSREAALLAAAAALRGEGYRLVVVDAGPSFGAHLAADDLTPLVPIVRGSPASLVAVAEERPRAMPAYVVERVAWERRFGRTVGWTFAVARPGASERALFHAGALGRDLVDLGPSSARAEAPASRDGGVTALKIAEHFASGHTSELPVERAS